MTEEGESGRRVQIAVAVIGAVGLIVAGVVAAIATDILGGDGGDAVVVREAEDHPRAPRAPQGRITSPRGGEEVSPAFTAVGTLSGIHRGHHVWLATQVDNLLFPKEPEVPAQDQRWIKEVVEGGSPPGGTFSPRVVYAARVAGVSLVTYGFTFSFSVGQEQKPPAEGS